MPFKSEAQRKFLWAKKPEVAKKFAEEEKKNKFSKPARIIVEKEKERKEYKKKMFAKPPVNRKYEEKKEISERHKKDADFSELGWE